MPSSLKQPCKSSSGGGEKGKNKKEKNQKELTKKPQLSVEDLQTKLQKHWIKHLSSADKGLMKPKLEADSAYM